MGTNNTNVNAVDVKKQKIKCLNLIKAKEHLNNLYEKYNLLASDINLLIGETDDTPNVIDNISEAVSITREVDTRRDDVYTHIHHTGDGTSAGPKEAFTATASGVKINYQCKHLLDDTYTLHSDNIPVASASLAGIITAESGAFFDENTTGKVDTLDSLKDFLDGVEENTTLTETIVFAGNINSTNFESYNNNVRLKNEISSNIFDKITSDTILTLKSTVLELLHCYWRDTNWDSHEIDLTGVTEIHFKKLSNGSLKIIDTLDSHEVDNYYFENGGNINDAGDFSLQLKDNILSFVSTNSQGHSSFLTLGKHMILKFSETNVIPLETRLDEKLGKTVYNTTDANNILKGLVLHSSTDLQTGPLEITLPFKLDSSILSTELNVNSMLEGVWIIDTTGSIYEVVDDDTLVSLVKITDLTTTCYSSPQFINRNEIKLTLAL